MYNNYEEEEEDWDLPEDKDPFQEDVNTEVETNPLNKSSCPFKRNPGELLRR